MKGVIDNVVIAEASRHDLLSIEGNWYFPPSSIVAGALVESPTPYTCPWKGVCQYYDIVADGVTHSDGAWAYPTPYPSAFERVGADFSGYVAFGKDVSVID
ncbi:DUF427 domain-containing protein [Microbacterium sp. UBA837]|uniref:DUF427 domain-containing protein n=1 Tax=Microbacterium sp. UBA837 TaxID=1946956 RepID=UPI0025D3DA95|nr:DUF427 domain-containing protein [Microbacterium sp. UBA837]|tara:strand:+ start:3422 stop:3724 length:303 start_codon:yes stop_codon:yes gene_type:complete